MIKNDASSSGLFTMIKKCGANQSNVEKNELISDVRARERLEHSMTDLTDLLAIPGKFHRECASSS